LAERKPFQNSFITVSFPLYFSCAGSLSRERDKHKKPQTDALVARFIYVIRLLIYRSEGQGSMRKGQCHKADAKMENVLHNTTAWLHMIQLPVSLSFRTAVVLTNPHKAQTDN